jgi:phage protein
MKENALSVANYFIDLAGKEGKSIRPLKLMKLVYMAYGYGLALINRSIIDPRFDKVEAWRYGPVIPSVYHSFKQYREQPVTEKTVVMESNTKYVVKFVEPKLEDKKARDVCNFVWNRYKDYSDSELVELLHGRATPWAQVYREGENNPIPEIMTKLFYKGLVERLIAVAENG